MSDATTATLPVLAPRATSTPPGRFVLGWMLAWLAVGVAVALGIVVVTGRDLGAILLLSVLFAQVVGLTAFTSARFVFPLFEHLPFALRLVLEVLTVLSGTVFGSIAVIWLQPLFIVAQFRTVAIVVLVNAALALIVGIALNTYDNMKRQLEESYSALRAKEAMERQLDIAREVQEQLLPRGVPDFEGLELAGVWRAAVGVGGDYYDYVPLDDKRIGLVIADVSGKGFPAALLMAGLRASLRCLWRSTREPGHLNGQLSDHLFEASSSSRYATMFVGFYDATTRTLSYSNAGHLPPVLLRGSEVVRLEEGGMPIGLFDGTGYEEGRLQLQSGDLLALFTDGVIEAPDEGDDEFGEERLIEVLCAHHDEKLDRIVEAVLEALHLWGRDEAAHDDVTLLLARVR